MTISIARLKDVFSYNHETGRFIWLDRKDLSPPNRSRIVGTEAFLSESEHGYLYARLRYKKIYAHRAAFAICNGRWPVGDVDHINGDRKDNRILNLREVSRQDNMRNAKKSQRNTSGTTGVIWNKAAQKWSAQIGVDRGSCYLGLFESKDAAIEARLNAERRFGFHANHGRAY